MERVIYFNFLASQDLVEPANSDGNGNIGSDRMGCAALLDWLEEQLGTASFESEQRLFAFYQLLNQYIVPGHSIYESFSKNPMATSRVILSWFDALTLIGWRGEELADKRLKRLAFLSEVYINACQSIAGQSDALRIEQCLKMLGTYQLQVNKIVIAQPKTLLPSIWQSLFDALAVRDIIIIENPIVELTQCPSNVIHILASGVIDAASITAQYLSLCAKTAGNALIVSEDGAVIDKALSSYSMPSAGFKDTSDTRLITQIIPAMVNTLNGTYSIENMVVLFSHPLWLGKDTPSKKLASKLVTSLGIDNDEWEAEKKEVLQQNPELADWLAAIESAEQNVPQFCKAIASTRLKALKKQQPIYREFARQCQVILDVLESPNSEFSHKQLAKILKELSVGQLPMSEPLAQVASSNESHGLLQPGHLNISPDQTLWVGPYFKPNYKLPDWYQPELEALAERYVMFNHQDDLELQRNSWNHFLQQTQHHLVVVDFDSEKITHPLFDELEAAGKVKRMLWTDYLLELESERIERSYSTKALFPYAKATTINQALQISDTISASRLEKLIFKPSDFVLSYIVKLRDYNIELPVANNRSAGLYTHALFEAYFNAHPTPNSWDRIEAWEEDNHSKLFKEHALVYLESGVQFDKQSVRDQSARALVELVKILKRSGVVRVTAELNVKDWDLVIASRTFKAIGSIDLLLEKSDGNVMILDTKWTNSSSKKHTKALEKGFAIQLYTYAAMYYQKHKRWPDVGYFIVKEREFLVDDRGFLQGDSINNINFAFDNVAMAWETTKELAAWRLEQFENGKIELNNPGCEPLEGVSYPDDAQLKEIIVAYWNTNKGDYKERLNDRYSDYRYLLGWPRKMTDKSA
jgi:hypothetical protein